MARESDDPPDFWFTIDGEEFAVEVTAIVAEQKYHVDCRDLAKAIDNLSREQGVLCGTYVLHVWRQPELPKKKSSEWLALLERTTAFVGRTHVAESADEHILLVDEHGRLGIQKLSSQGATVEPARTPEAKWQSEVQEELCQRMQERVDAKRKALEKKGVPCRCPRIILAFYDAYGYGDVDDAQKALLRVAGYEWFQSVFWAASFTYRPNELSPGDPGRKGAFLHSRKEEWLGRTGPDGRQQ